MLQIREGLPLMGAYSIEALLYKYGVDLHFQAHEHSYERMWPVYNSTVSLENNCLSSERKGTSL
jgi:hypothetical protein